MARKRDYKAEYARLKERAQFHGFTSVKKFKEARALQPERYYAGNARLKIRSQKAQEWSDRRAQTPIARYDYDQYVEDHSDDDDMLDFMTYTEAYYEAFIVDYDTDRYSGGSEAMEYWFVDVQGMDDAEYDRRYSVA